MRVSSIEVIENSCNLNFYSAILVDVPGCEPYREYLYTYLRDQPIWHSLRFWNAAFFDSLQNERGSKPVPPTNVPPHSRSPSNNLILNLDEDKVSGALKTDSHRDKNSSLPISDNDISLSSSSTSSASSTYSGSEEEMPNKALGFTSKTESSFRKGLAKKFSSNNLSEIIEDKKFQQNITFGQLGYVLRDIFSFIY